MRDLAEWIQVRFGSGHGAHPPPRANGGSEALLGTLIAKRVNHGVHIATNGTGRSIDDDGAQLLDSELGATRLPFAEDSILMVDARTESALEIPAFAAQTTGPPVKGEIARNGPPVKRARLLGSVVRDITRHNGPLRQATLRVGELAAANRRKDEFLAMLSHELRSPLASIHAAVRLLGSQTGETPAQQRIQALMERQLRRMTQLVDELLDVSRISNGRLHLQRERLDLRAIVSHAIETLESDIKERNHRLSTALPKAPVWLQADPCRLEQVFVNLLANASRYTDAGGQLSIWVHTNSRQAIVRVRDSGIGIAPETLPHIFELFKQADETDQRSRAGLGVGLAVVRKLVELHGGSVTAASAGSGQGSEFTVRLPTDGER